MEGIENVKTVNFEVNWYNLCLKIGPYRHYCANFLAKSIKHKQ